MRLLLDTHALIWFLGGNTQLPPKARDAIEDADNDVFASAASAWEVATKFRKGKLPEAELLAQDFEGIIADQGITELPITARHARLSGSLGIENEDPFDRMIIAQGLLENLTIVTIERSFETMGIVRLWA